MSDDNENDRDRIIDRSSVFSSRLAETAAQMAAVQDKLKDAIKTSFPLQDAIASMTRNSALSDAIKSLSENSVAAQFAKLKLNIPDMDTRLRIEPVTPYQIDMEALRPQRNPAHDTNAKLELLLDQTARTNTLLELSIEESKILLKGLNDGIVEVAIATAIEAKATREQNARDAKGTRTQNTLMIGMALISLMITAWFSWWSYYDKKKDIPLTQLQSTLSSDLHSLSEAVTRQRQANTGELKALSTKVKKLSKDMQTLKEAPPVE
jgi:hypothetical protein